MLSKLRFLLEKRVNWKGNETDERRQSFAGAGGAACESGGRGGYGRGRGGGGLRPERELKRELIFSSICMSPWKPEHFRPIQLSNTSRETVRLRVTVNSVEWKEWIRCRRSRSRSSRSGCPPSRPSSSSRPSIRSATVYYGEKNPRSGWNTHAFD